MEEKLLVECANGCGEIVLDGGFCSVGCSVEYDFEHGDNAE